MLAEGLGKVAAEGLGKVVERLGKVALARGWVRWRWRSDRASICCNGFKQSATSVIFLAAQSGWSRDLGSD